MVKSTGQQEASHSPRTTKVMQRSKRRETLRQLVIKYHTARLDNLLTSNGLKKVSVYPDGNCFFNSVLPHSVTEGNNLDADGLRELCVGHLRDKREHYIHLFPSPSEATDQERQELYEKQVDALSRIGHWNFDIAHYMPLVVANIFNRPVRIYSSRIENSVFDVLPDLTPAGSEAEGAPYVYHHTGTAGSSRTRSF
jgi:hypothetical protein